MFIIGFSAFNIAKNGIMKYGNIVFLAKILTFFRKYGNIFI